MGREKSLRHQRLRDKKAGARQRAPVGRNSLFRSNVHLSFKRHGLTCLLLLELADSLFIVPVLQIIYFGALIISKD